MGREKLSRLWACYGIALLLNTAVRLFLAFWEEHFIALLFRGRSKPDDLMLQLLGTNEVHYCFYCK